VVNRTKGRAFAGLVLAATFLGVSPILVRVSLVGPIATAFWRLALALLPLVLLFGKSSRDGSVGTLPRTPGQHVAAAVPGVFLAADLTTWHISLHMTSVANSTLLTNMAPVLVTLASWLFLRQPVTRVFLAGLVLSIVGVVVLKGGPPVAGAGHLAGDVVAMGAACFYAGYLLFLGLARQRFPTMVVLLWSTVSAAVCTLPIALVFERSFVPSALVGWAILIALAWIVHVGGQGLITYSLAWLPTAFSSLTLLVQPVVAAILAWVLLGESLSGFQIAGGSIVIAGIAFARRGT
jgi:drug/metabolite transporter (DMT)-like permease